MDINLVSSNKTTLNIRTPQGGEVPLNKGEVLQAQVQDVGDDGLVTIVVKGKQIEAATEVPVKAGQQLMLVVDDVRNGKTYLKVVTPEMMNKIENANISASLLEMGIAAKEDTVQLARKLLQYNLPVNQNNLVELNKSIKMLGGMNARNLEIATFALSQGISGKAALDSLAQFLSPQSDTAKLVPVLGRIMDILANNPGLLEENSSATQLKPSAGQLPSELATKTAQSPASNQALSGQSAELEGLTPGSNKTISSAVAANVITSEAGDESINSKVFPASSQAADSSAAPKQINNTNPVNIDKTSTAQANPSISLTEGEEPNSNPKLLSTTAKTISSEEIKPNQTTTPTGDKVLTDQVKTDIAGNKTIVSSGKSMMEQPAGAGTLSSALNMEPELNAAEKPVQDKAPAMADQNAKTSNSSMKSETAVKNSVSAAISQPGEQLSAVQPDKASPVKPAPNNPPAPIAIPVNDEFLVRTPGLEASALAQGLGTDLESPKDILSRNLNNLLDSLRSLMEMDPKASPEKIAVKLQDYVANEKDIMKALTLLKDMANSRDISEKLPQLKDFAIRLNGLEKEIAGQQLLNISSRIAVDNMSSYYFAFPVPIDQSYSLCQLKINKDGRKSLRDVDRLSFVVSLNTTKLGTVLFHVQWQKAGTLEVQGVVENENSCAYLTKNTDELVKNLEALGYRVKHNGIKVSSSGEEFQSIRPALVEVSENLRPLGIDVTV